jgi:dTMP kinase
MFKNSYPGKFIVFEGLDGSGKATQARLLLDRLRQAGRQVETIDFPQHGERSAALADDYLSGKYGTAEQVGPYRASIFFACDRYVASFKIKKWLSEGRIVIADRYVGSAIGHQGGKINDKKGRRRFLRWLFDLEFNIFGIPKPDVSLILKTSPEIAKVFVLNIQNKEKRARRQAYLGKNKRDIHEKDLKHLANALRSYLEAAKEYPRDFRVVDCLQKGKLLSPEKIHEKVWSIVKNNL